MGGGEFVDGGNYWNLSLVIRNFNYNSEGRGDGGGRYISIHTFLLCTPQTYPCHTKYPQSPNLYNECLTPIIALKSKTQLEDISKEVTPRIPQTIDTKYNSSRK